MAKSEIQNAAQEKAAALLHRLIQEIDDNPDNYQTYYDMSALLVQLKSYTQAEELLLKALAKFAKRSSKAKETLTYGLGNVYYAAGEYQKAVKEFAQIKEKKLRTDAYLMLAQSYMAAGNHKLGLTYALTAAQNRKQDPVINQLVAQNLLALGHFKEAASYFDRVLESDPQNGPAQFDRGLTAVILEQDASDYFKKAAQLDPDYFERGQQRLAGIQEMLKTNHSNSAGKEF